MANEIRRKIGQFLYPHTSFLRVMRRNYNYEAHHRSGFLVIKFAVFLKLIEIGSARLGYDDWLASLRKENSPEVRLEISRRKESTIAHLEKMDREIKAIKMKQKQSK